MRMMIDTFTGLLIEATSIFQLALQLPPLIKTQNYQYSMHIVLVETN